jgi:hypothetical protein
LFFSRAAGGRPTFGVSSTRRRLFFVVKNNGKTSLRVLFADLNRQLKSVDVPALDPWLPNENARR